MQTLGISESTPRSESRLKSLFWPSVESGFDVDYLASQGFWVCTLVATLSFIFLLLSGHAAWAVVVFLLFYLGGVGVREHSRYAATVVFVYYVVDNLASLRMLLASPGGGVLRVVITALLLSNLRATWIASGWKAGSEEAVMPVRLNDTFMDRFANRWPMWLWPKLRVTYYILSAGMFLLLWVGLVAILLGHAKG